jgi:TM2 domain-containing membrane protein YozV
MSDVSQGEGWWEAADGKWYPPTETPGGTEVTPAPVANRYCTNCAAPVNPAAAACMSCGFSPSASRHFCGGCGTAVAEGQAVCTNCGEAVGSRVYSGAVGQQGDKNKIVAGVLGILLGWTGAHKFYLGYTTPALIMLGATVGSACLGAITIVFGIGLLFFFVPSAVSIVGIIEGIMYLTKSDQQFYDDYVLNKKEWF